MKLDHKTAIARKALPLPVRWLLKKNLITGKVLDFGCGKCKALNDTILAKHPGILSVDSYDPFYAPKGILLSQYDTIICTYVLCATREEEQSPILKQIQSLLEPNGNAYISVRNDKPVWGYGLSSSGTYQRRVKLSFFEVIQLKPFRIYLLTPISKLP